MTDAEHLNWKEQSVLIPPVQPDAYKYSRGVAEIYAGSVGYTGAARMAAAGAQAAGAGLVKLVVDDDIYPVIACNAGGTIVMPKSKLLEQKQSGIYRNPDAMLLGPGWGRGEDRKAFLQQILEKENERFPLILDADALVLIKQIFPKTIPAFRRPTLLTPHAGEMEALTGGAKKHGITKEQAFSQPALIADFAQTINAAILYKSHSMIAASPKCASGEIGKLGLIKGNESALATGGSGDFLAGLCAGIAARQHAQQMRGKGSLDLYTTAAAAGTLLIAASKALGKRFYDPMELAFPASQLAGEAWLS